ncbi:MAG: SDR family NAD(P)-dependent oxidoreductase [Clostridia bacterium]|nr:SDR family NAD(P)-dependent oxidoreductase [Clostridia bacterium]
MKALITGATSGIGLDMARYLATMKCELILVARNREKLEKIQELLATKVTIIVADLSNEQKVKELYVIAKQENIDILINNAGFGDFGYVTDTDMAKDIEMINTNIKAVHILTKSVVKDMEKKNTDTYILNVASSAGLMPGGPLMSTYYATKAYVRSYTEALYYEEKKKKTKVHVSVLCPGPVDTNFNNVAGVHFSTKPLSSSYVAKYAIDKMFEEKLLIIPGTGMKMAKFFSRFVGDKFLLKTAYKVQKKKTSK